WKEAWLKRSSQRAASSNAESSGAPLQGVNGSCSVADVLAASSRTGANGETLYSCQATDVLKFTSHMRAWDPRQYFRDLTSGNLSTGLGAPRRAHRALELLLGIIKILHAATISFFNHVQERRHCAIYPFIEGRAAKTPLECLDLRAGELVQIRSKDE